VASDSIAIINCNIWDISEDGIYLDYSTNPRIMNCHLWNIGMEWFEHVTAPGDGIQLTWGCTNMKIWNTIVDRRTTAGKFSIIIAANDNTNPDYNVSLIGNTIYTPKDTLPRWEGDQVGGAGLYITDCYSVVVARNTFIGRGYNGYPNPTSGEKGQGAVYILQNGRTDIYYNVFDSVACGGQISACDPLYFYNNTIMSDQTTDNPSLQFKIRLSGIDNGIYANNISAGSVTYPGLIVQTSSMTALTNLSSTTNPSTWNAYFGIEDWTTSNYALSSTASIAYNTGTSHSYGYDIDSVAVPQSTLYDIGAYEFAGEAPPPVVDPPIANFSASSLEINETQTVQFTDLSTETPTSWAWVFEGGTPATSAAQNPLITYNTAGTYTVTLTATNAGGSDDEIKTNFITVRTENAAPRGSVLMDGTNVLLYNGNPVKY
jgi:PKD repeat protein